MDYLSSSFKTIFHKYLPLTTEEAIQSKQKVFFINESLKVNKLAYAYFLDRYGAANRNEQLVIDSLNRYQWFAGSLTAELFAKNLLDFLDSPESSSIANPLRQKIQEFAAALQDSQNQGFLIDMIRSTDLKLIFLILTGIPISGSIKALPTEIEEITQETLSHLHQMKPGDKRIFLLGDLFHETRLVIEKQKQGWEISYIDPAQAKYKLYKSKEDSPILETLFWDKIYNFKFLSDKLDDLDNYLESHLGNERVKDIPKATVMKQQKKNTCHFKGLLGALKKACLSDPNQNPETALSEWKAFKLTFGEFLLKNPALKDKIKILAERQQEHRSAKLEKRELFLDLIQQGKYEEVVKDYLAALTKLGSPDTKLLRNSTPLEILFHLDESYRFKLTNNSVQIDTVEPKLKEINDPCLNLNLQLFKNSLEAEQQRLAKELESEMNTAQSTLGFLVETVRSTFGISDQFKNTLLNFKPLEKGIALEWLNNIYQNPNLLTHLNQRPIFVGLLIQSIYLGETKKVKTIYDRMSPQDQVVLINALKPAEDDNNYFSPQCLPDIEFTHHPLDTVLTELLMKKAVLNSSIKDIYLIEQQNPGLLEKYQGYFKPTREQILAFFAVAKEQDLKGMQSEAFDKQLGELLQHIALSDWFYLLEKAPAYLLDKLILSLTERGPKELLPDQLEALENNIAKQSNIKLASAFKDNITLNQYAYKFFDKILANETVGISNKSPINQLLFADIQKEDINPVLNILGKSTAKNLNIFLLHNLLYKCRDKDSIAQILHFAAFHNKEALMQWLTERTGAFAVDKDIRMTILECIIDDRTAFDDVILTKIVNLNMVGLNETSLNNIEALLKKTHFSNIQFDQDLLKKLPQDLIEKYPNSLIVIQARLVQQSGPDSNQGA